MAATTMTCSRTRKAAVAVATRAAAEQAAETSSTASSETTSSCRVPAISLCQAARDTTGSLLPSTGILFNGPFKRQPDPCGPIQVAVRRPSL